MPSRYSYVFLLLFQLIAFLETNGLREEGLLRIPGSQQRIKVNTTTSKIAVIFFFLSTNFSQLRLLVSIRKSLVDVSHNFSLLKREVAKIRCFRKCLKMVVT